MPPHKSRHSKSKPSQISLPGMDAPTGPSFDMESRFVGPVAGIDEAGRGALAGPVVAAAVILHVDRLPVGINDSKILTSSKRDGLFDAIMAAAEVGIGVASHEEIDSVNILQATFLAMKRALDALPSRPIHALIDGNQRPPLDCPMTCVVKGDALCFSIAAASIIAKVHRDRLLKSLDVLHPGYNWGKNAGYGTADHLRALEVVGPSPFHRKSFAPIRKLMTQESDPIL